MVIWNLERIDVHQMHAAIPLQQLQCLIPPIKQLLEYHYLIDFEENYKERTTDGNFFLASWTQIDCRFLVYSSRRFLKTNKN